MPVVKTLRQKKVDGLKTKIRAMLRRKMAEQDVKQARLAEMLCVSQPAVSKMISSGNITLLDMLTLDPVLRFNEADLMYVFGRRLTENL